jgi:hypothetical protein
MPLDQRAFDGSDEELDELLAQGLESGEPVVVDADFWARLTAETNRMIVEHQKWKDRQD